MKRLIDKALILVCLFAVFPILPACMSNNLAVLSLEQSIPSTTEDPIEETPLPDVPAPATPVAPSVVSKKIAVGWERTFSILSSALRGSGTNLDGVNSVDGQLGIGLTGNTTRTSPTAVDSGTQYLSVVSGEMFSCAMTNVQRIKCWGLPSGDGTPNVRTSPTLINDTSQYVDIAAGSYHACGVTSAGVVKCWGDGWDGKLGNGDTSGTGQDSPVVADSGTTYKKISAGRNHTCGLTVAGKIRCWGTNSSGQVGIGSVVSPQGTPQDVDAATEYIDVATGEDTSCGITKTNVLKCWGGNSDGQLGDGSTTTRTSPVVIDSGVSYASVSIGGTYFYHSCGITTSGVLKCWGNNSQGQLGRGNTTNSTSPVIIDSGVTYREVSAFGAHSCGITSTGVLKCWGKNAQGQLGLGNTTAQTSPATVGSGF